MKREPWTETYSGHRFYILNPRARHLSIEELAHSLANLCRFNGHVRKFYSVAQHSVLVSQLVEKHGKNAALWGLLHEVDEPYLGDLVTPVKYALGYRKLKQISNRYIEAARVQFKLGPYPRDVIKHADLVALVTEKRDLLSKRFMPGWLTDFGLPLVDPLPITIEPWGIKKAKRRFLERYEQLRRA